MAFVTDELVYLFDQAYPRDFLEDSIRTLATVYLNAYNECKNFYPKQEAHDLRPHVRRAKFEVQLRELATRYPEIKASVEPNEAGTSYYTCLSSNKIVLTACAVQNPSVIVRRALFRETYARGAQLNLFEPEMPAPEDARLYVILLHGPDAKDQTRPGFAHIVFPNSDCDAYLTRINLFDRYSSLINSLWSVTEEKVEDNLQVGLRQVAKKKSNED